MHPALLGVYDRTYPPKATRDRIVAELANVAPSSRTPEQWWMLGEYQVFDGLLNEDDGAVGRGLQVLMDGAAHENPSIACLVDLAWILAARRLDPMALPYIGRAAEMAPDSRDVLAMKALVEIGTARVADAISTLEKACNLPNATDVDRSILASLKAGGDSAGIRRELFFRKIGMDDPELSTYPPAEQAQVMAHVLKSLHEANPRDASITYQLAYAALVNAVQHELPSVASETAPSYLVDACRMALVKDPVKRLGLVSWDSFRPPPAASAAEKARKRVGQRPLLAQAEAAPVPAQDAAAAQELLDTVIEGLKVEFRRIRQANSSLMPPVEVTRAGRRSPGLSVWMKPSENLKLAKGLWLEVAVQVIDVDAQAIIVEMTAAACADPIEGIPRAEVFKGPYSSGTIGDRIEAALFLALDQAQEGLEGPLNLEDSGAE